MEEKVNKIDISELIPDDKNFNKGTEYGAHLLEKSFEQFGAGRSILLDKNNRIIAGNKATEKYGAQGGEKVIVVETDGKTLVAVKRTDVDLDTKEGRELALADNATGKADLAWDDEVLKAVAEDMEINTEDWGVELEDEPVVLEAEEDNYDTEQEVESRVHRGEVWQLGEHRLMCGDSTSSDVAILMNGEKADLVFTDPPYGIKAVKNETIRGDKPFGKVGGGGIVKANIYKEIKGDDTTDSARLNFEIVKEISRNQIIFGGNYFTDFLPPSPCWVIWDKENTGNFADVEMAWTSFEKGAKLYKWLWNGLCRQGERSVELKKRVHPTQKPVGLISDILQDFSQEKELIIDCFGGSGSTLIACEQINRRCYIMEYEEYYCDVILNRWETLTGKKAQKIE